MKFLILITATLASAAFSQTDVDGLLQQAVDDANNGDTLIIWNVTDTAIVTISDKSISLIGAPIDSPVVVDLDLMVTNSSIYLADFDINAHKGADGVDANGGQFCDVFLGPKPGGFGRTALELKNSTAVVSNVTLTGGTGGYGGTCYTCPNPPLCNQGGITQSQPAGGGGHGIKSDSSSVILQNVTLGGGQNGTSHLEEHQNGPDGYGGMLINFSLLDSTNIFYDSLFFDVTSNTGDVTDVRKASHKIPPWPHMLRVTGGGRYFHFSLIASQKKKGNLSIYTASGKRIGMFKIRADNPVTWSPEVHNVSPLIIELLFENQNYYGLISRGLSLLD